MNLEGSCWVVETAEGRVAAKCVVEIELVLVEVEGVRCGCCGCCDDLWSGASAVRDCCLVVVGVRWLGVRDGLGEFEEEGGFEWFCWGAGMTVQRIQKELTGGAADVVVVFKQVLRNAEEVPAVGVFEADKGEVGDVTAKVVGMWWAMAQMMDDG